LVLGVGELEIFLQPAKTGAGDVGSIKDIEDEKAEQCCNKMEVDLAND
jgi:hypothetical protein